MKKKIKYYCRHCGKAHNTAYMADICFRLDMAILKVAKSKKPNDE